MNLSVHVDNNGKDMLILTKSPTQGLGEHLLPAEKIYSVKFTVTRKRFTYYLHYNGANGYLFVNGTKIIKFKAKDSEIAVTLLCLVNISKDWTVDNVKKTGFNGYVYFSVDYDANAIEDILDIHNYLMKKSDIL